MRHLLDLLFPPRADERAIRDVSADAFVTRVTPRMVDYTRPPAIALLSFADPVVRSALHEAKYHGSTHAYALLGAALEAYLAEADEVSRSALLIPVPLGEKRLKERGYNQVERVINAALRHPSLAHLALDPRLITRARETVSQVSLPREAREENMRGAFTASLKLRSASTAELSSTTYIVIDDVITTGATLQAAVDALKAAGAAHIIPLALAH